MQARVWTGRDRRRARRAGRAADRAAPAGSRSRLLVSCGAGPPLGCPSRRSSSSKKRGTPSLRRASCSTCRRPAPRRRRGGGDPVEIARRQGSELERLDRAPGQLELVRLVSTTSMPGTSLAMSRSSSSSVDGSAHWRSSTISAHGERAASRSIHSTRAARVASRSLWPSSSGAGNSGPGGRPSSAPNSGRWCSRPDWASIPRSRGPAPASRLRGRYRRRLRPTGGPDRGAWWRETSSTGRAAGSPLGRATAIAGRPSARFPIPGSPRMAAASSRRVSTCRQSALSRSSSSSRGSRTGSARPGLEGSGRLRLSPTTS